MSNPDFLGRAITTVKKATELDTAGDYAEAYKGYTNALELFMLALKWEKNAKSKEIVRAKVNEYMNRAEKLKEWLSKEEGGDGKKPAAAMGSNGKASTGGGLKG
jgi:vacuolar protein-sorting-associated protein 4